VLLVDAALVVAMICLSGYGAVRLPPDARVPVHFGSGSWETSVPKTPGLVLWAAVGVVTWLVAGGPRPAAALTTAARLGLTVALTAVLCAQAVAVALAVTRSRGG
jgi:hypothetical protein